MNYKKIGFFLISSLFLCSFSISVFAGQIQEIKLGYNHIEKKLNVEVDFLVRDRQKDFVRKVRILRNGIKMVEDSYNIQKENGKFLQAYNIVAEANDYIEVKVFMGEGGAKTATLTVPQPPEEETKE